MTTGPFNTLPRYYYYITLNLSLSEWTCTIYALNIHLSVYYIILCTNGTRYKPHSLNDSTTLLIEIGAVWFNRFNLCHPIRLINHNCPSWKDMLFGIVMSNMIKYDQIWLNMIKCDTNLIAGSPNINCSSRTYSRVLLTRRYTMGKSSVQKVW